MSSDATPPATVVAAAAGPIIGIARTFDAAALPAPTPCADFDVHALLHHLLQWGPVLESCGRKTPAAAPAEVDLVVGDWRGALSSQLDGLVAAWGDPAAWEGMTSMDGVSELPAALVGGMTMGELVVHGWDLGRALGLAPTWDDDVLELVHREITSTAEMGRAMGVYGPEVPVPATASTLDRLLGLTGRNPHWAPGGQPQAGAAG